MILGTMLGLADSVKYGFRAAPMPMHPEMTDAELLECRRQFARAGIIGAQWGMYDNLISTDEAFRKSRITALRAVCGKHQLLAAKRSLSAAATATQRVRTIYIPSIPTILAIMLWMAWRNRAWKRWTVWNRGKPDWWQRLG